MKGLTVRMTRMSCRGLVVWSTRWSSRRRAGSTAARPAHPGSPVSPPVSSRIKVTAAVGTTSRVAPRGKAPGASSLSRSSCCWRTPSTKCFCAIPPTATRASTETGPLGQTELGAVTTATRGLPLLGSSLITQVRSHTGLRKTNLYNMKVSKHRLL